MTRSPQPQIPSRPRPVVRASLLALAGTAAIVALALNGHRPDPPKPAAREQRPASAPAEVRPAATAQRMQGAVVLAPADAPATATAPATGPGAPQPGPTEAANRLGTGLAGTETLPPQPEATTLFLTIVGDKTYMNYGPSGERAPPVETLGGGMGPALAWSGITADTGAGSGFPATSGGTATVDAGGSSFGGGDDLSPAWDAGQTPDLGNATAGVGGVVYAPGNGIPAAGAGAPGAGPAPAADPGGPAPDSLPIPEAGPATVAAGWPFVDRNAYKPMENAPQACPRTLLPGSDQSTADQLMNQFGCRYLSSCAIGSGMCTWHYMGQG